MSDHDVAASIFGDQDDDDELDPTSRASRSDFRITSYNDLVLENLFSFVDAPFFLDASSTDSIPAEEILDYDPNSSNPNWLLNGTRDFNNCAQNFFLQESATQDQ